jgi:tetratricopeptide (TPR) repeat protein
LSYTFKEAWLNTNDPLFLEKAVHAQKKAIGLSPMQPEPYLELAKLFEDAKRLDEARFTYEKAASIYPNTLKYKDELALFLERHGETEAAIALWEDLKVFLEKYEPRKMNLLRVYTSLAAMYKKRGNLALFKKYLDSVVNFPEDCIKSEPPGSPVRKSFIDLKKMAEEELDRITRMEHPRSK